MILRDSSPMRLCFTDQCGQVQKGEVIPAVSSFSVKYNGVHDAFRRIQHTLGNVSSDES